MRKRSGLVGLVIAVCMFAHGSYIYAQDKAVVVKSGMSKLNDGLSKELKAEGYAVVEVDKAELANKLAGEKADLLVLTDSASMPFGSAGAIQKYLEGVGKIIALNTPMWQDGYDNWLKSSKKSVPLTPGLSENTFFTPEDMKQWGYYVWDGDSAENKNEYCELVKNHGPAESTLHVTMPQISVWNTFNSPKLEKPFKNGQTLTVFYAKGSERTNQLYVEWVQEDGSKWFANVPLTTEWKQYVLTPEDFYLFGWSWTPKTGPVFEPEKAAYFRIGIFKTHIVNLEDGRHEYWLGPVGTARKTDGGKLLSPYELPFIDSLSPWYVAFDCNGVSKINCRDDQQIIKTDAIEVAKKIRSPHQRASGNGFGKNRKWRWIPLMEAQSAEGEWRGTPATLMVHADGKYKGGIWASFGVDDPEWYASEPVIKAIGQTARRMADGVFILDGGSNFYTYFEGQDMTVGMRLMNAGKNKSKLAAKVTVINVETGKEIAGRSWPVEVNPGQEIKVSDVVKVNEWPQKGLKVTAELTMDGVVIDRVSNEAHVRSVKPKEQRSYITTKDGDFVLNGKRWRVNGINYMPSSGVATHDIDYMNYWLGSQQYDPEVVKRDLKHVKDLGFNSVSVFLFQQDMRAQNLLDFLRLCDEFDLKVNLAMRPGTPIDFEWDKMKDILEFCRIAEYDSIFALDLAWEPEFARHDGRKRWDGEWQQWIIEQYGSIANAEKDWQFALPIEDGKVTNPLEEHLLKDGPWRRMTAAYRRFLDLVLYESHLRARDLVRSVDPYHHVSFRMSRSGDPSTHALAYDWPYLSAAVDVLEPEGYGRIGGWETVKKGRFTFEYARWAGPELPMIWAEMGYSAYDQDSLNVTDELLRKQAEFYSNYYRMMIESGADGYFSWWYPGGFRVNERSDFGVINPDGTDRPVSKVLRERAAALINGPDAKPINAWIEIDRDKRADGMYGIYEEASKEFWGAIDAGKVPGLRTAGTDTNSANCPLTAVGNTEYNGNNPPKYLDGYFDRVEVQDANGKWVEIKKGGNVEVTAGKAVTARVTVTNLGEPCWLSPAEYNGAGGIYLAAEANGKTVLNPLPGKVSHSKSITVNEVKITGGEVKEPVTVSMTFLAKDRAKFGQRFSFQMKATSK